MNKVREEKEKRGVVERKGRGMKIKEKKEESKSVKKREKDG